MYGKKPRERVLLAIGGQERKVKFSLTIDFHGCPELQVHGSSW